VNPIIRLIPLIALGLLLSACDLPAQKPVDPNQKAPLDPIPEKLTTDPLLAKLTKADPNDDALRILLKARYNAAHVVVKQLETRIGNIPGEDMFSQLTNYEVALKRLRDAGAELIGTPEARIEVLKQHLASAAAMEKKIELRVQGGIAISGLLNEARCNRLDAEIQLLKAQRELEKAGKK